MQFLVLELLDLPSNKKSMRLKPTRKMIRVQLNLQGIMTSAGSINRLTKQRFMPQVDLKKGRGFILQSTIRQIIAMQQRTMLKIRPPDRDENLMPTQMIRMAYCSIRSKAVRRPNMIWSSRLSLMKAQLSFLTFLKIESEARAAASTMKTARIGGALDWKLVVPKKSLSRYMLLSISLQFCGLMFWPMIENSIKYQKAPRRALSPALKAVSTSPTSPKVCMDRMKQNTY